MDVISEQTKQFANSLVGKYYVDAEKNRDLSGKQVIIKLEILYKNFKLVNPEF